MIRKGESDGSEGEARAATLALLAARAAGATLCPSEVARALAAAAGKADWRGEMPAVHAAVDRLAAEGLVRLSWKGAAKARREGPYRIGRGVRATSQSP
ncbi:MAG: DUF3253 domain-containing protein [Alphaproteobacteria bacterium]|nr:DUF3253 domain-containing protein [Alphaproteobacteria bacterium]MBV9372663.1 DUF3253 domain-containing protein [Alphaproteobacteria bacterium]MBV9900187.1 DUF3253 domain-containing protein [Alphaproteobacteria bacterium]